MTLNKATKAGRTSRAKALKVLTTTEMFFFDNAGYSYEAGVETAQLGRVRNAKELANAVEVAKRLGWEYEWNEDIDGDLSWMSEEERKQPHEVLCARIFDPKDSKHSLASLCGITDADRNYGRVIEAELALEALADYDRETEILDAH